MVNNIPNAIGKRFLLSKLHSFIDTKAPNKRFIHYRFTTAATNVPAHRHLRFFARIENLPSEAAVWLSFTRLSGVLKKLARTSHKELDF
jgi:hypothetical protein